jgi:hypothetical protein
MKQCLLAPQSTEPSLGKSLVVQVSIVSCSQRYGCQRRLTTHKQIFRPAARNRAITSIFAGQSVFPSRQGRGVFFSVISMYCQTDYGPELLQESPTVCVLREMRVGQADSIEVS